MRIKSYNKKRMFGLLVLPLLVGSLVDTVSVSPAVAAVPDYSVTTHVSTSYTLYSGEWLSVTSNGTIDAVGTDPTAVEVAFEAVGVTIDNAGTIVSGDYDEVNAIFVGDLAVNVNISNASSALIDAQAEGHAAGVQYAGDLSGTLDNAGTVSAGVSGSTYATAHGVLAAGDLLNLLDNSGTISADANASSWSAYAKAFGVTVDTVVGTLDNSGLVSAYAGASAWTNDATAQAAGVTTGTLVGLFDNSGTISAQAEGWASDSATVTARGIDMGTLSGTLDNSGTISADAFADSANGEGYATAVGIDMGTLVGTLVNGDGEGSGVIEAYAYAEGSTTANAVATGIDMNTLTGSLDNSGVIYAKADASSATWNTATAIGIKVGGALTGTLDNSGRIAANSDADGNSANAYAAGIEMGTLDVGAMLTNSADGEGGIHVDAHADAFGAVANAEGAGIAMGNLEGTLDNSGLIDVQVWAHGFSNYDSANADAYGITLGTLTGTLDNSGTIQALAEAADYASYVHAHADAYGIDMGNLDGTLTNSGLIAADAEGAGQVATADAFGITLNGDIAASGTLTNSGTVAAHADASADANAYADAYGIRVDGDNGLYGTLENTVDGEISASAYADAYLWSYTYEVTANAFGITVNGEGGISGTLTNSGTVSAYADAEGYTNADANAAGILVGNLGNGFLGDLTGDLTNDGGLIRVEAAASASYQASANAMGILLGDVVGAETLTNSGTITAAAYAGEPTYASGYNADLAYAFAGGIVMAGDDGLSGVLDNSGSIYADAGAKGWTNAVAYAAGIVAGGENGISGTLDNSGTVRAESWAYAEGFGNTATAAAYGVVIGGSNPDPYFSDLSGTLLNVGTDGEGGLIDAYADATGYIANATAAGILMQDITSSGSLDNSGVISVYASAEADYQANAHAAGIQLQDLYGTLENSGTIAADAGAWGSSYQANANAAGILMDNLLSDETLTNSGRIYADAEGYAYSSADANATADGILVRGLNGITGTLENLGGTINAWADASAYGSWQTARATAAGIRSLGDLDGTLDNTGTIAADAYAEGYTANATATGVSVLNIDGSLDNGDLAGISGKAAASGTYAQAMAYGVDMVILSGTLDNSGTISAEADVWGGYGYSNQAAAHGIDLHDLSGELKNSGTISADATADSWAYAMARAYATAIDINGKFGLEGMLDNTDTIQATASASASYQNFAFAEGVNIVAALSGTLDNSGTISAEADASGTYVMVNAAGILVNGEDGISGSLDNSGLVSASADGFGAAYANYADAVGIAANGEGGISGTLDNSGTIEAAAFISNTYVFGAANAYATGIETSDLDGLLDNSGLISATADATADSYHAYAYATGIDLRHIYGTLDNSGTISADANAYAHDYAYAYAEGISMDDLISVVTLDNSETIEADAYASATYAGGYAYAYAKGINLNALSGLLDNTGTVSAFAEADAPVNAYAYAEGINLSSIDSYGTLHNDGGEISGTARVTGGLGPYARAYGIYLGGDLSGTLDNEGLIKAEADAVGDVSAAVNSAEAYATGIYLNGLYGTLDNSGTISADAHATHDASAEAYATGVYMSNLYGTETLLNSGTISALAHAESDNGQAFAYYNIDGVRISGELSGRLFNDGGLIASTAEAYGYDYAEAKASGIEVSNLSGTLDNSGTISGSADASATYDGGYAYAEGVGVRVTDLNGTLNNSGAISGEANEAYNGYSVYASYGEGGEVNNQTYGLLSGNLYLGGEVDLNNSGTVALPLGANAYVGGYYDQSAVGTLAIEAKSDLEYSNLRVEDTAAFAEGTTINVTAVALNTLDTGDILDNVVDADTLLYSGTYDAPLINVTDNSALLDFTAFDDGEANIDLNVYRNLVVDIIDEDGTTGAMGLAELLDEMLVNPEDYPGLEEILGALNELDTAQEVADAVNSMLPTLNSDLHRSIFDALHQTRRIVRVRTDDNKGMNSGDDIAVNRNVWGKVFGSKADQNDDNGSFGYTADSYGIIFGADTEISARATLGAAVAYIVSDVDGDNPYDQNADIDSYQAILYGSYDLGDRMTLGWQADYAMHQVDTERKIFLGPKAKGDFDSWSTHFGLDIDRSYPINEQTTLVPSARIDYTYIDEDSYKETGAGKSNLEVDSIDADELIVGVDGKVLYNLDESKVLTANVGIGYDLLADDESINSAFAGTPGTAFKTTGIDPSPLLINAGVGVEFGARDGLQVNVRYDIEGREDFTDQSVSLRIKMPF